jgi:hypothetical protein
MSRARLKVAAPCACAGLLTPGFGPPLIDFGEVPLVRKIPLYAAFALLAAVQFAGLANAVIGAVPAFAGPNPLPTANEVPEPALNNPDIVRDFMALLPPSDSFQPAVQDRYQPFDHALLDGHRGSATAHRFYTERKRGARAMAEIMDGIVPAFIRECEAKGGHLQPRGTDVFRKTYLQLAPPGNSELRESNLHICMRSPSQSLGAIAVQSTFHLSISLLLKDFMTHTVVAFGPSIVVTQADIERRQAAQQEADRQASAASERQQAAVERWRQTIKAGTETNCGPVLRVNSEMVELVHYQTRESKWYRRSELWPELWPDRLNGGSSRSCR